MARQIKKAALIYLSQGGGSYYLTDELSYDIQRRPALGLQYLSAVLEAKNVRTNIFDQTVERFDLDKLIDRLKGFDLAGFYCSDAQEAKVKVYSKKVKEALGIPVLVGGPSTLTNTDFLDYGCDVVVHGEAERTIEQLLEYYLGNIPLQDVRGITYKFNGNVVSNKAQDFIENLDALPFPDRSKVDIRSYYDFFLFGMKKPYAAMMTSRGCAYSCHFCVSHKIWGHKYRRRSVDNVIAEIDELAGKYKVKYISFHDDVFITSYAWIEEFCRKLIKKPYKIKWIAVLHPFSIPRDQERILKLMKQAGCDALSFGLQSAHPEVLKGINRHPQEAESLKQVLRLTNKFGIQTIVFYIFGLPGDTEETIKVTADYSLNCGSTFANYFVLSILRGSELEKIYLNKQVCSLPQERISELAGSASRRFYAHPKNLIRISYFLSRNPAWLFRAGLKLPSVLARIGFLNSKHN
ncbi:MAG: radical SAM protein [Candidatus Omnitrophota bacterium]|nr:radical SAM protein [Candidatus Omnitrophota bacterium]